MDAHSLPRSQGDLHAGHQGVGEAFARLKQASWAGPLFVFIVVPHALGAKLLTGKYVERGGGGRVGLELLVHGGIAG